MVRLQIYVELLDGKRVPDTRPNRNLWHNRVQERAAPHVNAVLVVELHAALGPCVVVVNHERRQGLHVALARRHQRRDGQVYQVYHISPFLTLRAHSSAALLDRRMM